MSKFQQAIVTIWEERDREKHPKGMGATDVREELFRRKEEFGIQPEYASVIDVADEMKELGYR